MTIFSNRKLRNPYAFALSVLLILGIGLATESFATPTSQRDAEKLLVVDCLLPGQLRKLGRSMTFLTARKAIKTTAIDCEIRGGEYIAYDRSNYGTALKVWLPLAQKGDPKAQTYVGEIYEKGLGITPDYQLARGWYQKAAEQGFSGAQINLGYLYESGLGVPRDLTIAMNWYRKASGLTDGSLEFVSSVESASREAIKHETAAMQGQIKQLNRALIERQSELDATRQYAKNARRQLAQTGGKSAPLSNADSQKITRLNQKLQVAKREKQRLSSQLQDQTAMAGALQQQQDKLGIISRQLAKSRSQLASTEANLARTQTQLEARRRNANAETQTTDMTISELQSQVAQQRSTITKKQQDINELQNQAGRARASQKQSLASVGSDRQQLQLALDKRDQEVAKLQNQLTGLQENLSSNRADNVQMKSKMEVLELDLATREKEIVRQQQDILQIRTDLTVKQQMLANTGPALVVATRNVGLEIEIIDPPLSVTRSAPSILLRNPSKTVELVGKVTPIDELFSFRINSQERKLEPNGLFRAKVSVATAKTPVSIVAIDKEGRRSAIDFDIIPSAVSNLPVNKVPASGKKPTAKGTVDFGNYYALVIGNNQYKSMPNLVTAVADAKDVASVLKNKYGFDTTLLINADRYAMLSALNEMREKLTKDDNLLIYYAGHGELDSVNLRGHWLPVDAEPNSTANWISNVAVTDILNVMAAKHVLVVADSCYSGSMTRSSLARLETGLSDSAKTKWLRTMSKARTRAVLTSGGVKPVLDSGGGEHSIFASAFLEVLRSNEGILEGFRLYRQVQKRVKKAAASLNFDQNPRYAPIKYAGHEAGEFFFLPDSV